MGGTPRPRLADPAARRISRSTHRGPISQPNPDDYDEHDDHAFEAREWSYIDWAQADVYEDSLPDPGDDWDPDIYDVMSLRADGYFIDDSPAWESDIDRDLESCSRCGDRDDLDPLSTCAWCRAEDGRCTWCGLDAMVYETNRACRTCYQRLRRSPRTRVTNGAELQRAMLAAAFRRVDLRKRRPSPPD